ncbi:MAG: TIGR00725 family protein [Patescibacteria group bacterium]
MKKRLQIGVIGFSGPEEFPSLIKTGTKLFAAAEQVGRLLAQKNCIVITGGKTGVMEAAARGARTAGGLTVGVICGTQRRSSNAYTDVEVLTGMSAVGLDELLLILMCDALISIGGGAGTLEEITLAYRNKKPVVALRNYGGWTDRTAGTFLDERQTIRIDTADSPVKAVEKILAICTNDLSTKPVS